MRFRVLVADDADRDALARRGFTRIRELNGEQIEPRLPTIAELEPMMRERGFRDGWRVVLVAPL